MNMIEIVYRLFFYPTYKLYELFTFIDILISTMNPPSFFLSGRSCSVLTYSYTVRLNFSSYDKLF